MRCGLLLLACISLAPINHQKTYGFDPRNWTVICLAAPYQAGEAISPSQQQALAEEGWWQVYGGATSALREHVNAQCVQFKGFVVP